MTWRVRVSADMHFHGLDKAGNGAIQWFVPQLLKYLNMTNTWPGQPLWIEPIHVQIQLFSRLLNLGGQWSLTNLRWASTSDFASKVEFDEKSLLKKSFVLDDLNSNPLNWKCIDLPKGAYGGANASMRTLLPLRGWGKVPWAKDAYDPFSECPFPEDCVGVEHEDWNNNMSTGSCKEGTEKLLCAVCKHNYNREGSTCRKCSSADKIARIVFGVVFFVLPVGCATLVCSLKVKKLCE